MIFIFSIAINEKSGREFRAALSWLRSGLFAQTETGDQGAIALDVLALQVVEQLAALGNQAQQTTAGVMILGVLLEVWGQVVDASGQQRNLDFRRTGVTLGLGVVSDDGRLVRSEEHTSELQSHHDLVC